ncbi:MAG: hypothetical protein FWJ65_13125 [Limnochordales bacterium]
MRLTPRQYQELMHALEVYESAGDVAAETGLPLRTVIHYQRLYGPLPMQLQRAREDRRRIEELKRQALQETGTEGRHILGSHRIIAGLERRRRARWRR